MSETIQTMPDATGTHAHYYLTNGEEPRGCLVLRDDAGTVQYLFRDGSVLEWQPDDAPQAVTGDPVHPVAWQTFVTVQGQWQTWRYDLQRGQWMGTIEVKLPSENVRLIATSDWDHPADLVGNGDDVCVINVAPGPGGYYVTINLDCNTGGFCENLATDDGPWDSFQEAVRVGRDAAISWFIDNDLPYDDDDAAVEDDAPLID